MSRAVGGGGVDVMYVHRESRTSPNDRADDYQDSPSSSYASAALHTVAHDGHSLQFNAVTSAKVRVTSTETRRI